MQTSKHVDVGTQRRRQTHNHGNQTRRRLRHNAYHCSIRFTTQTVSAHQFFFRSKLKTNNFQLHPIETAMGAHVQDNPRPSEHDGPQKLPRHSSSLVFPSKPIECVLSYLYPKLSLLFVDLYIYINYYFSINIF